MLINWFTVIAQAVNFIILVYLLKRFLYGPIIKAMEAREKRIADQLAEAARAKQEAQALADSLKKDREDFALAREDMLAKAREEIVQWRDKSLETAREEVDRARDAWVDRLEGEKESFRQEVKTRVADLVLLAAKKVLEDLAEGKLEEQVILTFLKKCGSVRDTPEIRQISGQSKARVLTGFPLGAESQTSMRDELMKIFQELKDIDLEVNPDIGLGLRLVAGDFQVEWNLSWYLQDLEAGMFQALGPARRAA
ncbi:MAG: F0F1 ATP synthase subunit B [Desulfatibacillum sp.]|nr:F0F1 ATP synthase subunit B [Desulfatibacillum sp.]